MARRTVTKRDLCERIAATTGCTGRATKAVVQQFLNEITAEIAIGNRIELRDFGVFGTRVRSANKARNPRTSEAVDVPARTVVSFKAGKRMAEKAQGALRSLQKQHGAKE